MIPWFFTIAAICLGAGAYVFAAVGIGGGAFYTPILLLFDMDIHEAATTSLFLIMALSAGATFIYRSGKRVDWRMAFALLAFTTSGGFIGGYASTSMPAIWLSILLVITLIAVGLTMLLGRPRRFIPSVGEPRWYVWRRTMGDTRYEINVAVVIPVALLSGIWSGMMGIGGGVLLTPVMTLYFMVPMDIAAATNAFMVGVTAAGGFTGRAMSGHWDWRMSVVFAVPVLIGSALGASRMLKMDRAKVKRLFGVVALLLAIGVILKTIF